MLITVHVPLPLPRIPAAFSRFAICSYVWRFDRRESTHFITGAPARCGTARIRVIIAIDGPALRLALCLQMAHGLFDSLVYDLTFSLADTGQYIRHLAERFHLGTTVSYFAFQLRHCHPSPFATMCPNAGNGK
jgi:hypothetical protein